MSPSSVFHPLSSNCASCCGGRLGTRKRRRLDSQATNAFIPPLLIGALPSDRSRRLQNPPRSEPTKSHACILKASVPYFSIMLKGSRHDAPETRIGRVDEPGRACRRRRPDARPARPWTRRPWARSYVRRALPPLQRCQFIFEPRDCTIEASGDCPRPPVQRDSRRFGKTTIIVDCDAYPGTL